MQIRETDSAISLPTSPTPPPGWFKGTPWQHNELNGPECTRGGGGGGEKIVFSNSFFFSYELFSGRRLGGVPSKRQITHPIPG